jgi:hypothetical protein
MASISRSCLADCRRTGVHLAAYLGTLLAVGFATVQVVRSMPPVVPIESFRPALAAPDGASRIQRYGDWLNTAADPKLRGGVSGS